MVIASRRTRRVASAGFLAGLALAAGVSIASGGGTALADPRDWVPVCTGNEVPGNSACRIGGPQGTPLSPNDGEVRTDRRGSTSPGANPYVRLGVTP